MYMVNMVNTCWSCYIVHGILSHVYHVNPSCQQGWKYSCNDISLHACYALKIRLCNEKVLHETTHFFFLMQPFFYKMFFPLFTWWWYSSTCTKFIINLNWLYWKKWYNCSIRAVGLSFLMLCPMLRSFLDPNA